MRHLELDFPNWTSFVDYATDESRPRAYGDKSRSTDDLAFFGTETWQDAVALMRKGWIEGIEQARSIAEPIQRQLYSMIERQNISYDVTGELLDVGRYCSGEPEHWGNWESELVKGQGDKHVHIVVNIGRMADVGAESIIARGATIAALVNLLDLAGHRCQVTARAATKDRSYKYLLEVSCVVKQYDEPLDMDRLIVALAHPSTHRRLLFAIREGMTDPVLGKAIGERGSYGRSADCTQDKQGDLYFEAMQRDEHKWIDPEQATKYVYDRLVEYNVIKPEKGVTT